MSAGCTAATIAGDGAASVLSDATEIVELAGTLAVAWLGAVLQPEARRALNTGMERGAVLHVMTYRGGLLRLLIEAENRLVELARRTVETPH